MTRSHLRFAAVMMAAGLALPASLSRAENKIPTPPDCRTGVPGTNQNSVAWAESHANYVPEGGVTAGTAAYATGATKAQLNATDQHFVMEAANGGMAEVQLGQLAQQRSQTQAVRDYGRRMVDDHSRANDQLRQVAMDKGIALPTQISGEERARYDQLSHLSGTDFDKAYIRDMFTDHQKDVAAFQNEANHGKDADVKAFAAQTLPTLQQHLDGIREVAANYGDTDLAHMAGAKMGPDHP